MQHNLMQFVMFLLLSVSLAGDEAGEGAAEISERLEYHTSKPLPRQPHHSKCDAYSLESLWLQL